MLLYQLTDMTSIFSLNVKITDLVTYYFPLDMLFVNGRIINVNDQNLIIKKICKYIIKQLKIPPEDLMYDNICIILDEIYGNITLNDERKYNYNISGIVSGFYNN